MLTLLCRHSEGSEKFRPLVKAFNNFQSVTFVMKHSMIGLPNRFFALDVLQFLDLKQMTTKASMKKSLLKRVHRELLVITAW